MTHEPGNSRNTFNPQNLSFDSKNLLPTSSDDSTRNKHLHKKIRLQAITIRQLKTELKIQHQIVIDLREVMSGVLSMDADKLRELTLKLQIENDDYRS